MFWRLAPLGLPPVWLKYGGSVLWAAMIYWLVAAIFPRKSVAPLAVIAGLFAAAVEFFKLVQTPALDAFRHTLAGKLLLGRVFSFWDIAVYWLAVAAMAIADLLRFSAAARHSSPRRPSTRPR